MKNASLYCSFVLFLLNIAACASEKLTPPRTPAETISRFDAPLLRREKGLLYMEKLLEGVRMFQDAILYLKSCEGRLKKGNIPHEEERKEAAALHKHIPALKKLSVTVAAEVYETWPSPPEKASKDEIICYTYERYGIYKQLVIKNNCSNLQRYANGDLRESRNNRQVLKKVENTISRSGALELFCILNSMIRWRLFGLQEWEDAVNKFAPLYKFFLIMRDKGKLPFHVEAITSASCSPCSPQDSKTSVSGQYRTTRKCKKRKR